MVRNRISGVVGLLAYLVNYGNNILKKSRVSLPWKDSVDTVQGRNETFRLRFAV